MARQYKKRATTFVDDAILVCQGCGVPYATRHYNAPRSTHKGERFVLPRFCSWWCQYHSLREFRTCAWCGTERYVLKSVVRPETRFYCSRECFGKGLSKFNVGAAHHNFKGGDGWFITPNGYAQVRWSTLPEADRLRVYRSKSGWVMEHRVVMARILGRPIRPGEKVHHRNGVKHDNRPENLEVAVDNGEHTKLHASVYAELRRLRLENEQLRSRLAERSGQLALVI
jgi:hypothetical protein